MALVFGLDLGTGSVGWAVIEENDEFPARINAIGVRVFDAGVEGVIEEGKDKSRNVERREARLRRRQTSRRAERLRTVADCLQRHGLLPQGDLSNSDSRHKTILSLDVELRQRGHAVEGGEPDLLPYKLRAKALDAGLEPIELGRAIYHLAQRRGFQSNRKTPMKDGEELGKVKTGIKLLEDELDDESKSSGARTLGKLFATINPHEKRIRNRYTHRDMYKEEFELIWSAQEPYHPEILTQAFHRELKHAIFHQRPLKSQKHTIARCELEPKRRRASWALLEAQRFRLLQRVNDLLIVDKDRTKRRISPQERETLLEALEYSESMTFAAIRKLLKISGTKFNLEEGGEKKIPGNSTVARLCEVFGNRWDYLSGDEKSEIIHDVESIRQEEVLAKRGKNRWKLDDDHANAFGKVQLEDGYCAHSRVALTRLLPHMESGLSYMEAVKAAYPQGVWDLPIEELLPPVLKTDMALRNPAVIRTLTEMRKVVNALIRTFGKPDMIRLELARDLKQARHKREKTAKRNRERQKERDEARKYLANLGMTKTSRDDIDKFLLWEECNRTCPYTGKTICFEALFGPAPRFDVEHIIPFSRCLDNSYLNKTLCDNETNRAKGNKTPQEMASGKELDDMLHQVRNFKGDAAKAKLERFLMTDLSSYEDFTSRMLNDTRYASTQAVKYLARLYGGEWRKHIQVSTGQVTHFLRDAWRLNKVLGDGDYKNRNDHRHHSIDALVIASVTPRTVRILSKAAEENKIEKGRIRGWWNRISEPWPEFLEDVKRAVETIVVSHRVTHKVNGELHKETNYGRPRVDEKGRTYVHIRKPLDSLSPSGVTKIVDDAVRRAVERRLQESGNSSPKDVFKGGANLPFLTTNNGGRSTIRSVRVRENCNPRSVGRTPRYVLTQLNHHVEIVENKDKYGNAIWEECIVTNFDALKRANGKPRKPVVNRDHGAGKKFLFSLSRRDTVQLFDDAGNSALFVLLSVSKSDYELVPINDARSQTEIKEAKERIRIKSMKRMQQLRLRKVAVTPLGDVVPAND